MICSTDGLIENEQNTKKVLKGKHLIISNEQEQEEMANFYFELNNAADIFGTEKAGEPIDP